MIESAHFWMFWFALLGVIIGSFLNVVIYRMHTGAAFTGRSRCLSCGHALSVWHLVPLLSYIALLGRCAFCKSRISPRYFMVEVMTGLLFGVMAWAFTDPVLRILFCLFSALLVVVIVYDMLHTIIPDEYALALTAVALAIGGYEYVRAPDTYTLLMSVLGGVLGFSFFASLWLVSKGRWVGLGDAKLAFPFGIILGFPAIISGLILSFWIGAVVSVGVLLIGRLLSRMERGQHRLRFLPRALTMKSEIPFAPFLVLGFLLTLLFSFDAFSFPYTFF